MFDRTLVFNIVSQVVFGCIGALMIQLYFMPPHQQLATVNITGMVKAFVKTTAIQHLPVSQMKTTVKAFSNTLNEVLTQVAAEKQLILVPSEVVIAGSEDVTSLVQQKLQQRGKP